MRKNRKKLWARRNFLKKSISKSRKSTCNFFSIRYFELEIKPKVFTLYYQIMNVTAHRVGIYLQIDYKFSISPTKIILYEKEIKKLTEVMKIFYWKSQCVYKREAYLRSDNPELVLLTTK